MSGGARAAIAAAICRGRDLRGHGSSTTSAPASATDGILASATLAISIRTAIARRVAVGLAPATAATSAFLIAQLLLSPPFCTAIGEPNLWKE